MALKIIYDFDQILEKKWMQFVLDHPHGNIFQTPYIYKVFRDTDNFKPLLLLMLDEADNLLGLVVAVRQYQLKGAGRSFSGRSIVAGGPLILNDDTELFKELMNKYDKLVSKDVVYTEIRNQWDTSFYKNTFNELGYKYSDHLDILIDLSKSEDELWNEMNPARRKQIGRARKRGTVFAEVNLQDSDQLKMSHSLIRDTYRKINLPVPAPGMFEAAVRYMNDQACLKIFSASFEGQIISVRYILCFKNVLYDWFTGSDQSHLDKYPNDLLPWEILLWGRNNGFQIFDFGGAGKPGKAYSVRDYKIKFGGKLVNQGRYQKIHKRLIMKISVLGFRMMQIMKMVNRNENTD